MADLTGKRVGAHNRVAELRERIRVYHVTLTKNIDYRIPDPSLDFVHSVVFTQDEVGGRTVTYGGQPVAVDTAASAKTAVELWPTGGSAWRVVLPSASAPGGSSAWADVTGKPSVFPPDTHSHPIAQVEGLQDALDGKQPVGEYAASVHEHDSRYVRTVNGTGPDPSGNVAVAGGGGAPPAISRNVMTAQYRPLPGHVPIARDVAATAVRTTAYFYPVRAAGAWTVGAFAIKVSAVVAGGVARIWVFNADNLEQPTTLALDATGSGLPLDTAGLKEVSGLNHTFPAGNYVVVLTIAATANPTLIGVGCAPDRYELAGASWWNERIREGSSWTSPAQVTTWTASFTSTANPVNLVFWR